MFTVKIYKQIKQKETQERTQLMISYLSISCEGNSVVGATGHLCHSLVKEVGGHQGRGQSVVGGPIAQLAVAIVSPSKHFSIYTAASKLSFMLSQWLIFY